MGLEVELLQDMLASDSQFQASLKRRREADKNRTDRMSSLTKPLGMARQASKQGMLKNPVSTIANNGLLGRLRKSRNVSQAALSDRNGAPANDVAEKQVALSALANLGVDESGTVDEAADAELRDAVMKAARRLSRAEGPDDLAALLQRTESPSPTTGLYDA